MAKGYCLVPELADKLKQAALAGDIAIEKMYEMTSQERRALFEKHIDERNAQLVNAEFEKAMVSEQQNAMLTWAKKTFTASEKKTAKYQDVIAKINDLDKLGVLTPESQDAFLEDLVASKLGVTVTADEASKIATISKKLESLSADQSEFNTGTYEYFKARKEMDDYLDSLTPSSSVKILSSTIARGTLLASIKSPLLNIESNTVNSFLEAFTRRITTRSLGGKNNALALRYIGFAVKVYKDTGYDITRMTGLQDFKKTLGEERVHSQGSGTARAVGRVYEDLFFNKPLGIPDIITSATAFADRANIESSKIASKLGLKGKDLKEKAAELFKDATGFEPKTEEGTAVRNQAVADAMYTTYTNESTYAKLALHFRKGFNIATGDLRVGDQIMPFVKTPANVIGSGINSSGVLLPADVAMRMGKTIKALSSGSSVKDAFGDNFAGFTKTVVRSGLGLSFAFLLTQTIKPEDFIGEYPTSEKEKRLLEANQATPNSIKVGNKWVSLDYFGVIGAPLVGMLYAKKYGKDLPTTVWEYYKGVGRQAAKIPGFDEFYNTVKSLQQVAPGAGKSLDKEMTDVANFAVSFVRSRVIPSLVSDVAKATDTSERKIDSTNALAGAQAGIPGLRENLPEKTNIFGEVIKTEPWFSTLLFGSRVKTASDDPVVGELNRLSQTNHLPSITDVSKTSDRAIELKTQIGDEKFSQAMKFYGQTLKKEINRTINSTQYKRADDETKQKMLNKVKDDQLDKTLSRYHYKKPKKK